MFLSQCGFHKDVSISPDATIPKIVKEMKKKQTEISSDSERESDLELEQNKLLTKIEALHCLQTIRWMDVGLSSIVGLWDLGLIGGAPL